MYKLAIAQDNQPKLYEEIRETNDALNGAWLTYDIHITKNETNGQNSLWSFTEMALWGNGENGKGSDSHRFDSSWSAIISWTGKIWSRKI